MIAITAASMVPMLGVVGGAIDISRIYLAKSRLQAACDAGVLAGRKAMTTVVYTSSAQTRAERLFNFNFDDDDYSTSDTSFTASADEEGRLIAQAGTTIPMVIMHILGAGDYDIDVTCSADIQVPNIDVVFVLDVTGSMDETLDGTKKIVALRSAAINFYDTLAAAMVGNTRSQLRYGFVPYAQAVNARELFTLTPDPDLGQLSLDHLVGNATVQSRVANFNTEVQGNWVADTSTSPTVFDQVFRSDVAESNLPNLAVSGTGTKMSNNDCDQYSANLSFSIDDSSGLQVWFPMRTSWPGSAGVGNSVLYKAEGSSNWQASEPTTGTSYTRASFARVSGTWADNNGAQTGNYRACTRRVTHTRFVRETGFKFTNWTYRPVSYNVSGYKSGTGISYVSAINSNYTVPASGTFTPVQLRQLANQSGLTGATANWSGCVEERQTTPATSFAPIPSAAFDMDFLTGGISDEMRWKPVMDGLTYNRGQTGELTTTDNKSKPSVNCPSASMRNLRTYPDRQQFVDYVNSLSPSGNTYLDVGMIWGLRLIAPQGMFADRNLTGPNGGQISRHLIFLTDGVPVSSLDSYSAYGTERMERRITGSTGVGQSTLHSRRFQAMCDAQRGSISIWAIAFGTSVSGNLSSCADSGRAMQANNTAQLQAAFTRIANEVADLRLVE